jgi:hypothetical protein
MSKKPMKAVTKASGSAKSAPKLTDSPKATIGADERKWRVEDAMRTLMRAEEHKKDKGLMRDVGKMAKEQAQKLSGLCGKAR